jgi:mannan endo-1,4-beta-mannosidase
MMRLFRRLGTVVVVVAAIAAVVAFGLHDQQVAEPANPLPPTPHAYLGVYVPGMPASDAGLIAFGSETGTRPNVAVYYSGWLESFQTHFAEEVTARGAVPLVQIDPQGISLAAIAHGQYDGYLASFAQELQGFGHPVIISFGHEMNGDWYSWGRGKTSPADFVAAWRHIVNVFRTWGVFNVTWLWTINSLAGGRGQAASPEAWWPGASYVDWVGIDGYYYYQGESFRTVFGSTISVIRHFTKDPVFIPETGIAPAAGKAATIPQVLAGARSAGVLGVVYFDANGYMNWSLNGDAPALAAFGKAARGFG